MQDELLAEILAVEQEIRHRIADQEAESAARLDALARELAAELARETERLQNESGCSLGAAEQSARDEADSVLATAQARGERLAALDDGTLDRVVRQQLQRIRPEVGHDCQDEQA
jgi:vacuolar-type H+-ATPase subunit H